MSDNGDYSRAEICRGGHVVRRSVHPSWQTEQGFCEECGESIIDRCPSCQKPIKGASKPTEPYKRPNNCRFCGKAYPWGGIAIA